MINIIKKTIVENQRTWHEKLKLALWADIITPKRSTCNSPYVLTYGKEARLPVSVELPTLNYVKEFELLEEKPMQIRLAQLVELEETHREAYNKLEIHHAQIKRTFDRKVVPHIFNQGDLVFKRDELKNKRGRHTSFDATWDGLYVIT